MCQRRNEILRLDRVRLHYPFCRPLNDISLYLCEGEAVNLFGLTGSGKSSLMKLLTGEAPSEGGRVYWGGTPVGTGSPAASRAMGIQLIPKNPQIFPRMRVADYLILFGCGQKRLFFPFGSYRMARRILAEWELSSISPDAQMQGLTRCQQHMLAVVGAAERGARLLVLDECYGLYSGPENEQLLRVLRRANERSGLALLNLASRLSGLYPLAQRQYILQKGTITAHLFGRQIGDRALLRRITGAGTVSSRTSGMEKPGGVFLELRHVSGGTLKDFFLPVREGECIGLFDPDGDAGRCLTGLLTGISPTAGEVYLQDRRIRIASIANAIERGIILLPDQLSKDSLFPRMSARDSLTLPCLKRISRFSVINRNKQNFMSEKAARLFCGREPAWRKRDGLSAQETLWFNLARCLTANPRLLILIHPDVYLDEVGLGELHELIGMLKKDRIAVLLVSNLHTELERSCDQILQPPSLAAEKEGETVCRNG